MTWTHYRAVTIDHTKVPNTTQTNFPVAIAGTFSYLATVANGGLVQNASGFDIAFFSDAALTTQLKHERTAYSATTGAVAFYVKVPSVSSAIDTVIYMAYGNAAISTDQSDATNVWDANFKAVFHFGDGTTLGLNDSTSNANTLTNIGSTPATTGPVDGAANFDGATRSLERLAGAPVTAPPLTIECLFNPTIDPGGSTHLVGIAKQGTAGFVFSLIYKIGRVIRINAIGVTGVDTVAQATLGAWNTAQAVFLTDSNRTVYVNGANGVNTTTVASGYAADDLSIGAIHSSIITQWFTGPIGEVRISDVARSTDWMLATHNNLTSPSTFSTIGAQQTAAAVITTQPTNTATGVAISPSVVVKATTDGNSADVDPSYTGNCVASIASGSGTLSGTTTVACVAGVATFSNLRITGVGAHTLQFAMTGYTSAVSNSFTISGSNTNPVATITAPTNLATVAQGASTAFAGSASDAEDGALTGASLQWTSSIDGSIGSGTSFSTSSLSLGTHTITLTATDSGALTGTATRTLVVATTATAAAVAEAIAFVAANGGDSVCPAFYDRRAGLTVAAGKVTTIKDIIGAFGGRTAGPDIVQATGARQPTLVGTQGSGTEEITFNSATDQWMASAADARFDASLNAPLYMYACYTGEGNGPMILIASTETSDTTYPNFGFYPSGGEHMFLVGTAAAGSPSPSYMYPTGVANDTTPRAVWGGHDIDLFSNANIVWQSALGGKQVSRPNGITRCTPGSNKVILGRLGAARGNGKFKALMISAQRPTSALVRNWYAYCVAHHGAQHITTFNDTWLFSSDSLGDGSHSSDPKTPAPASGAKSPAYMAVHRASGPGSLDTLGKDVGQIHRYNYAISGDNPLRMYNDFDYHIAVNDDGTRSGTGYVFIRGWENYIQNAGPSLATMQTLAINIKAKCEARGWKCIHEIPIDRAAGANGSNGNSTGFHLGPSTGTAASAYGTLAIQFRDWLKDPSTYLLAGHYAPILTGSRAEFLLTATGPNVAETGNGTIYDDLVHLKDAGYDIQKDVWKDYIDGLIGMGKLTRLYLQLAA